MHELLNGPHAEEILGVICGTVITALCLGTFLLTWAVIQWRLHRRAEMEAVLKKQMLDRGMSADEIERVISTPLGAGQALIGRSGTSARTS
jgi:hypothetical protein